MSGTPAVERYWRHVQRAGGQDCWLWTAAKVDGYGVFTSDDRLPSGRRRMVKAHRYGWELANGPIPDDLWALHTCDVRHCVNPTHLFLGTNADNMADQCAKDRHPRQRGEGNPFARLTEADVRAIRLMQRKAPARVVAPVYGVGMQAVYDIWQGRTWSWLAEAQGL